MNNSGDNKFQIEEEPIRIELREALPREKWLLMWKARCEGAF